MYILYFVFIVLLIIYRFDTQNNLEDNFTAMRLTGDKECDLKRFSLLTSGVSIIPTNIYLIFF